MVDEPDEVLDYRVANHIISVHQRRSGAFSVPYRMDELQRYIRFARSHKPQLTPQVCYYSQTDATPTAFKRCHCPLVAGKQRNSQVHQLLVPNARNSRQTGPHMIWHPRAPYLLFLFVPSISVPMKAGIECC